MSLSGLRNPAQLVLSLGLICLVSRVALLPSVPAPATNTLVRAPAGPDGPLQVALPVHGGDILQPPAVSMPTTRLGQQNLPYRLVVYYALPSDVPFDRDVFDRLQAASLDIQAWYQVATGGLTWEWADPEIVRVYRGLHTREHYRDAGNWWGSLLQEMHDAGYAIWEPGIVTAIWAQGAGWWAGGAQGCETDCGIVLLGVELFPEFNDPLWSGGACPDPTGYGGDAWPCTPEGAFAHELGHTLGLGHPYDDPATSPVAFHSIMQTHWNYPNEAAPEERPWGFLRTERQRISQSSFMKAGIPLRQDHQSADIVVNLPPDGAAPLADFDLAVAGNRVAISNHSAGAIRYYWTLGDYTISAAPSPEHAYRQAGAYVVTLRASSDLEMMSAISRTLVIEAIPPLPVFLPVIASSR